jgi:hypothetical protein
LWRVCEELKTGNSHYKDDNNNNNNNKNNGGKEFRAFRALSLQEESAKRT